MSTSTSVTTTADPELMVWSGIRSTAISRTEYNADTHKLTVFYTSNPEQGYTYEAVDLAEIITIFNYKRMLGSWGKAFSRWTADRNSDLRDAALQIYDRQVAGMHPVVLRQLLEMIEAELGKR